MQPNNQQKKPGQAWEQLNRQADAAEAIQGSSKTDRAVIAAARRQDSELDEIMES